MTPFVDNPVDFAADCACHGGRCRIARDDFLFLDDGREIAAVDWLQRRCGHVAVIAGTAAGADARLYHTSCRRMSDAVERIFAGRLGVPERLPQAWAEMTVGELHRRRVALSFDACRSRVDAFDFAAA